MGKESNFGVFFDIQELIRKYNPVDLTGEFLKKIVIKKINANMLLF